MDEGTDEQVALGQTKKPPTNQMNEFHEGDHQFAGSLYTSIPSSLDVGLGHSTPLENNARLILSHSRDFAS